MHVMCAVCGLLYQQKVNVNDLYIYRGSDTSYELSDVLKCALAAAAKKFRVLSAVGRFLQGSHVKNYLSQQFRHCSL